MIKRYYKLVRRLKNGRLVSQFITTKNKAWKCLAYKRGEITEAPFASDGIYLYTCMAAVRHFLGGNTACGWEGDVVCFRAYPTILAKTLGGNWTATVSGIKLGKRILLSAKVRNGSVIKIHDSSVIKLHNGAMVSK